MDLWLQNQKQQSKLKHLKEDYEDRFNLVTMSITQEIESENLWESQSIGLRKVANVVQRLHSSRYRRLLKLC